MRLTGSAKGQARIAGDSIEVVLVNLPNSVVLPSYDDEDEQAVAVPAASEVGTVRGGWVV